MIYRFLVIVEDGPGNYSAYSPDLLGCVATGRTREQVERNIYEAMQAHLQLMLADNDPIPSDPSFALYVSVPHSDKQGEGERMYRVLTIVREEVNGYAVYAADTDERLGWATTLNEAEQIAYEAVKAYSLERLAEDATYPSYEVYMTVPLATEEKVAALQGQKS